MVEEMAQTTIDPQGRTKTRQELFCELKELGEEVLHLRSHYLRRVSVSREKTELGQPIDAPDGYGSYREYRLHRMIDWAFNHEKQHGMTAVPSWHDRYFAMVDELRIERDQLRTYAARRSGGPDNRRSQDRDRWERRANGDPAPWSVGLIRGWARVRFEDGMTYEQALWQVANQVMMYSGELLDRRRADAIKKSVDREYLDQYNELPPKPPRGWWRPASDPCRLTLGGLTILGLAWEPPRDHPVITHWDPPPRVGIPGSTKLGPGKSPCKQC